MRNNAIQSLSLISSICFFVMFIVMGVIAVFGWKRHRQTGYLILLAWALLSVGLVLSRSALPFVAQWIAGAMGGNIDNTMLFVALNMLSSLACTVVLCLALAMLVFSPPRTR